MDLYAENILDHYRSPRGKTSLAHASVTHGEKNLSCGDSLTLQLHIEDDIIREIGWDGTGCAISQAGMSMLSEELIGKTIGDAASIDAAHVKTLLGVPIGPRRIKCALLSLHTLQNALRSARGQETQPWRETIGNYQDSQS
jgi:nitrogen fixation protein NifU and related proteins